MGQVGSTGEFTQEDIKEIKEVKDTDTMMNLIFRYMVKLIKVSDFMQLSQPDTCQEYVISLAQHMSSQFSHLQIMPYREKKSDVLLFKKYSDLNPASSTSDHPFVEKKKLCTLLSYYYVRIFQIYGALALTLLNDINLSEKTIQASGELQRRINQTPGREKTRVANIKTHGGATRDQINTSLFKCMISYFVDNEQYTAGRGWKTTYDSAERNGARVYFDKIESTITGGVKSDKGQFRIYLPATNDRYFTLDVTTTPIIRTHEDVTLKYTQLKSSDSQKFPLDDFLKPASIIVIGAVYKVEITHKPGSVTTKDTISDYFNGIFSELMPILLSKKKSDKSDTEETTINETDTPDALKFEYMKMGLEGRKTVGHCIARALQLLRTIPSTGATLYKSDICVEKFSFTSRSHLGKTTPAPKTGLTRGIPIYGESLAEKGDAGSKGFRSLVQLFYDTILIGSPQIVMGDTSFIEYKDFMKKMAGLFWDAVPSATENMTMDRGIAEIKNNRDKMMCEDELKSPQKEISISSKTAQEVSTVVRELYRIQVNHAMECGKIFKSLFDIDYDSKNNPITISLSKKLLTDGFEEIDKINAHARRVLIKYYTTCEHTYLQGVDIIMEPIRHIKRTSDAHQAATLAAQQAKRINPTAPFRRSLSNQSVPATAATRATATAATATAATAKAGPLFTFGPHPPATQATQAPRPAPRPTQATQAPTQAPTQASRPAPRPMQGLTRQRSAPTGYFGGTRKNHVNRQ